jgi:2OG-Fe(II) oxygenase superfamily
MINNSFINSALLQDFTLEKFKSNEPFPWFDFHSFLTPESFSELYLDFPSFELFEKHMGIDRNGQRPHNRYYLAYESTIYDELHREAGEGIAKKQDLPVSWQKLIDELETSVIYKNFIKSTFDIQDYRVRYAWHLGFNGSEVSPHRDSPSKIGTHIFYFNTSQDWKQSWGGEVLVLGDKLLAAENPEFEDFSKAIPVQITDNHSFLFKNNPDAWHGVKPLTCPEGKYRRLFNVIFEFLPSPNLQKQSTLFGIRSIVKKIIGR